MKPKFKEFDKKTDDAWTCHLGKGGHAWNYHRETQTYHCSMCFMLITKSELKRETDTIPVPE